MNVSGQTESRATGDIEIEYEFRQPPAKVWRALSEPELVAQWLAPGDIETELGRRFALHTADGRVECEVLECEPERLLSYSWRRSFDSRDAGTVVTFVLTETSTGGTHLRVIHSGFIQSTARVLAFRPACPAVTASLSTGSPATIHTRSLPWAA